MCTEIGAMIVDEIITGLNDASRLRHTLPSHMMRHFFLTNAHIPHMNSKSSQGGGVPNVVQRYRVSRRFSSQHIKINNPIKELIFKQILEQDPATGTQQTLYHFPNSLEKIIIHSVKTQILKIFLSENVVASFDLKSISLADEIRRSWNYNRPEDIWSRDDISLSQFPGKTSMIHRCQTVRDTEV